MLCQASNAHHVIGEEVRRQPSSRIPQLRNAASRYGLEMAKCRM